MVYVTTKVDKSVPANRWIASISDGTTIFQDITEGKENAWIRLKKHINENNLRITQLRYQLKKREHIAKLPISAEGYVYLRKYINVVGMDPIIAYGIGFIDNDGATIIWMKDDGNSWLEKRTIEKCGFGLIMNP